MQPTGPNGEDLGRVGKVATVYSDGIVYAHAADGDRGAVVALDASDGSYLWHFFGGPKRGELFTGLDGVTFDASATWGPVLPDGTDCAEEGGATSWMHGAVDPELGTYYMTFGNARSCTSSQNGSLRPGDNLFSSTMVAVDAATGEYKWHYQSIHHDVWDMDNVHPPTLADIEVDGEERKVVFYGSKSGHQFVLDRTNGEPVLPVTEKPMITDSRQHHAATQPFPETRLLPECVVWEKLDPENIPGDPWRAVPNYNGYQPDAEGNLVFNPDSYVAVDEPFLTYPEGIRRVTAKAACTTRSGICRSSRPPARTAGPTGRTTRTATARTSSTTRTARTPWRTGTARRPTASVRSGSTRPAASSPTTPRPVRSRGRTTSAPTCRTARDR